MDKKTEEQIKKDIKNEIDHLVITQELLLKAVSYLKIYHNLFLNDMSTTLKIDVSNFLNEVKEYCHKTLE